MSTSPTVPVPAAPALISAARIPVAGSLVTQNVSTSIHNAISAVVTFSLLTHAYTRTHTHTLVCPSMYIIGSVPAASISSLTGGELLVCVCVYLPVRALSLAKIHNHRCDCCCSHNVSKHVQLGRFIT